MAHELEPGVAREMRNVLRIAGEEIVDADDAGAEVDEPVAKMTAEKACAAGDEDALVTEGFEVQCNFSWEGSNQNREPP
jgi:hypothetical protein